MGSFALRNLVLVTMQKVFVVKRCLSREHSDIFEILNCMVM